MDLLVSYDVNTLTKEGRRRLRRVAKICTGHGQRVQFSVFEVTVNEVRHQILRQMLIDTIDHKEDSLRIYVLRGGRDDALEAFGRDGYVDYTGPLIV